MNTWLLINKGTIVSIITKDGNIVPEDYTGEYDTVQDDPSKQFKVNDTFTIEQYLIFNPLPEVNATEITKLQVVRQLKVVNLWSQFQTVLTNNQDAKDEWDATSNLVIADKFVVEFATALNITDVQGFFNAANKL